MANPIERLALLITANADGAISVLRGLPAEVSGSFAKVEGDAEASGSRAAGAFANTAVAGFATLAATAAAFKGFAFAKDSIETAVSFDRATASVNATLLATGNISGVTASGIDRISEAVEKTDVVFSGAVKNAAQLLLTFDQVRNQPGEGNDIFNRTLTITPAIANIRHQDVDALIKQVGLALENPSAGLLALKRSGVGLDDETRNQIIQLQRRGDLLGAQKTLLDDLDRRFSAPGAAIGQADPLQKFSVASSELKKTIGEDLLPPATGFLHVVSATFGFLEHFPKPLREVVELVTAASVAVVPLLALGKVGTSITQIAKNTGVTAQVVQATEAPVVAATTTQAATQAAATEPAIAGQVALTEAIEVEAEAAATAIAPNAALAEQLGLFGEEAAAGATGLATFSVAANGVAATTATFDEALVGGVVGIETFDSAAAGLPPVLEATQQGFFAASEGSRLFAVDVAGIAEVIGTVDGELAFFSGELSAVGPSVLAAGTDLVLFDNSVVSLGEALPPVIQQLVLFDEEVGTLAVELGPATAELEALGLAGATTATELEVLDEALVTTSEEAAFLSLSFGGVFAVLGAGVATLAGSSLLFDKLLGGKHEQFEALTSDVQRFGDDVDRINHTSFVDKVIRDPKETHQAQLDIADVNKGFTEILDDRGTKAASLALGGFINHLIQAGYSEAEAASALSPFIANLDAARAAENDAATSTGDLVSKFNTLNQTLGTAEANFKIADSFDALTAAQKQLTNDKANVAGNGPEAIADNKSIRDSILALEDANAGIGNSHRALEDSYARLGDAQDRVRDSTYSLQRAQEALDDYNSPRGARERSLQLDIIQRRVVTTPGESDQKQLDLLRFEDDNEHKQEDLSRSVTQAQKGHADALRGVADAYAGIDSAERGVRDATLRVSDAQDKVKDAIRKRQQLATDSAAASIADERKVKEAALGVADTINTAAQNYQILDPELEKWSKRLDPILVKLGLITAEQVRQIGLTTGALVPVYGQGPLAPGEFRAQGPPAPAPARPDATAAPVAPVTLAPPRPTKDGSGLSGIVPTYPVVPYLNGDITWFANGGTTEDHIAQIAGAGPVRMWAEPETGGEAYIPLSDSKRQRSTKILEQVAGHFGLAVVGTDRAAEKWMSVVGGAKTHSSAAGDYLARTEHADNRMSFADGGTTHVGTHYALGGLTTTMPQLPSVSTPKASATQAQGPQPFVQNVTQENHFDGSAPATSDLDYANRELGWRLSRMGRG